MRVFPRVFLAVGLCGLLAAGAAVAQQSPPANGGQDKGPPDKEHHMPPPEALAACKSLASGAACSMTTPRGTLTGTCGGPEGKPLACRPAHPPQGGGQGKPPPKPAN